MPSISTSCLIHAPAEAVFDIATNVENWAEIIPAVEKIELLTPAPVGLGTKFRETRLMFKKEATETMEFVEWERATTYGLLAESHGSRYQTKFTLTSEGDSTRLTMNFDATPLTFMAKVMSVMMKPMMKMMIKMCTKDLEAIKAHVESLEGR